MTTSKKASAPVQLSFGAAEIAASEALGKGIRSQADAMKNFLNAVIVPHKVSLADCLASQADRKAGNGHGQAQFEFTRLCFATAIFGADLAKRILSTKSTDETLIDFGAAASWKSGAPMRPNTARYVMQNQLGKDFKAFLGDLKSLQDALNNAADAAPEARGPSKRSTDAEFVKDRIGAVVKRMTRGAEKFDGSVSVDVAPKLAKALLDVCAVFGIK